MGRAWLQGALQLIEQSRAQACPGAHDWAELDEAFARKRDPLAGHSPEAAYQVLLDRLGGHSLRADPRLEGIALRHLLAG